MRVRDFTAGLGLWFRWRPLPDGVPSGRGSDQSHNRQGVCPHSNLLRASALALAVPAAFAQPGQPAPAQPSYSMQDSNLKPALPGALQGVGIDQKLNAQVPLDLIFRDEAGRTVPLSTFFHSGKPVHPGAGLLPLPHAVHADSEPASKAALKAVSLDPGQDFEIVAVSFDPKDTPEIAAAKKQTYVCSATAGPTPPMAGIS